MRPRPPDKSERPVSLKAVKADCRRPRASPDSTRADQTGVKPFALMQHSSSREWAEQAESVGPNSPTEGEVRSIRSEERKLFAADGFCRHAAPMELGNCGASTKGDDKVGCGPPHLNPGAGEGA